IRDFHVTGVQTCALPIFFLYEGAPPMRPVPIAGLLGLFGLAVALGGCGDSGGAKNAGKPADARGVIASAGDCVSFGSDAVKACAAAIERAVSAHEASTTSYSDLQACESAAGEGRCERAASGKHRARLSAFMVTVGAGSARAEPLYPIK